MNEPPMVEQPKAEIKTTAKKGPRGQVIVFANWCKGCGICVAFCPTGVLVLDDDDHQVVVYPEKCTACHWCDTHCPDLAIVVKKIEGV
jgi:2-oxoglutarate ferredoxin oxidoreductase subunit delta